MSENPLPADSLSALKAALQDYENRFQILFERSPTPKFVYDRETLGFLAVNKAACRLYGYSADEFSRLTLRDIALPAEVPAFLEKLSRPDPGSNDSGVWRHRIKDGKVHEMSLTSFAMDFSGRKAWLSTAIDVSERLSLEAQLIQSQKMESVGRLAGGIAHDFNNLLTVISGHASLLLARENLEPKLTRPLTEINEAARRAAELTRQLLTFSRKQVMQAQFMDLNEAVKNVTKMLRRVLGEDIGLEFVPAADLPPVKADIGMIEQVLLNLAVNSRDAMPKGGKLNISTSAVAINPEDARRNPEARPGRFVCLTIADSGCGIPPENLSRIFEPFFTTKPLERGTGLGLATVYGIVKQHLGWIEVSSEPGKGTTFQIFIPANFDSSPQSTGSGSSEKKIIGGSETILVVEDEGPLLELIRHILQSYGYKVLGCATGREALMFWEEQRQKIELLLTDMVLPDGMTGPELAEILRSGKPSLKVIFTSGYESGSIQESMNVPAGSNWLQKPFHARKLAEAVYDCLQKK